MEDYLHRRFEGLIEKFKRVKKEDLKQVYRLYIVPVLGLTILLKPNHLVGHTRTFIQLLFRNTKDLMTVRRVLLPVVEKNKAKRDAVDTYAEMVKYVRRECPYIFSFIDYFLFIALQMESNITMQIQIARQLEEIQTKH